MKEKCGFLEQKMFMMNDEECAKLESTKKKNNCMT